MLRGKKKPKPSLLATGTLTVGRRIKKPPWGWLLSRETNYRTEFVAVLNDQPQGGFVTRRPGHHGFGSFFQRPHYPQVRHGW